MLAIAQRTRCPPGALFAAITAGEMPVRLMPTVGRDVLVDFLGATVPGTVIHVDEDGRRVEVEAEDGARLVFTLNRATATFTSDGLTGARLRFVPGAGD